MCRKWIGRLAGIECYCYCCLALAAVRRRHVLSLAAITTLGIKTGIRFVITTLANNCLMAGVLPIVSLTLSKCDSWQ